MQSAGVAALLTRTILLAATVACAFFNGVNFSSWRIYFAPLEAFNYDSVDQLLGIALRGYPYMTRAVIYAYVTPVAITLMTLAIAGIPAALYERIRGLKWSTAVSLAIWLAATVLLALPAIMRVLEADELR